MFKVTNELLDLTVTLTLNPNSRSFRLWVVRILQLYCFNLFVGFAVTSFVLTKPDTRTNERRQWNTCTSAASIDVMDPSLRECYLVLTIATHAWRHCVLSAVVACPIARSAREDEVHITTALIQLHWPPIGFKCSTCSALVLCTQILLTRDVWNLRYCCRFLPSRQWWKPRMDRPAMTTCWSSTPASILCWALTSLHSDACTIQNGRCPQRDMKSSFLSKLLLTHASTYEP